MTAVAWIYATSPRATFAVGVDRSGHVVETAPYARRWLRGRSRVDALTELRRRGFETRPLA